MDKTYDQTKVESKWYKQSLKMDEESIFKFWEDQGFFKADPNSSKKPYGLLMPPPNLTGQPHAGHTLQHLIMDAVARAKRMQGFDVLFQPGVDHAGIQFEGTLNKSLEKEGLSKHKLGREAWLKRAWQFKEEVYQSFHATWRLLGISADWEREVFTLDPKVERAVLEEFKTFFEQDLIYKGAYIVQWCPKDQTAIEDVEMEYEDRQEKFYYINYPLVDDPKQSIIIATVRPETMFADVAVAVNPKDKRYKDLIGKKVVVPFVTREIPIIGNGLIDMKLGSGALKVDPAHSLVDYAIGKKNNLEIIPVIGKDGKLNENAGKFAGQKAQEVRKVIVDDLEEQGALAKTEDIVHAVPVCERCKTTIEPLISEEFFVKMDPLAKKALKNINRVNFIPKKFLKILSEWIRQIHDWCISRPLWWGYRIPVWYCEKCNPNHEFGKDRDMVISFDEPGKNCQTCSQKHWVQEEKILDTWFSSGLWPMATLGWPASRGEAEKSKQLDRYYPWDLEVTAREIRYLWIARMIMLGLWFKDDIPFKTMYFHGMLRPLSGPKFSKSLGNAVYASELASAWGVDATRMALYTYTAPDRDGRTSREILNERAKNFRNFTTKLKNISRFIVDLAPENSSHNKLVSIDTKMSQKDDQRIINRLKEIIEMVTKDIDNLNMHLASEKLYEFIWHEFADKYIESTKERRAEAQPVLEYVFRTSLELLHPFMPFITEELWQKLPHEGKSIMVTKWPKN